MLCKIGKSKSIDGIKAEAVIPNLSKQIYGFSKFMFRMFSKV